MKVSLAPEAERDLVEAGLFYSREANEGVGRAFIAEFERSAVLLAEQPQLGAPWREAVRRLPLRRFPYSIVARHRSCKVVKSGASTFKAKLLRPVTAGKDGSWAFLVLPKNASESLPRRGRTSVQGTINGHPFQATLEPDGKLSHWLRVSQELREAAGVEFGETVSVQISPVNPEPEPVPPTDLQQALDKHQAAKATWERTTTIARVDWIHWVESAKQAKTRKSRVESACDMLADGKKRVCCFDPSGYYSKSLNAPEAAE